MPGILPDDNHNPAELYLQSEIVNNRPVGSTLARNIRFKCDLASAIEFERLNAFLQNVHRRTGGLHVINKSGVQKSSVLR